MEVLNNRATKLEALDNLIDERNIKAKEAEQELILFIKNRPMFKNNYNFRTNDIVDSINYITTLSINNNTYPKLSEWKQLNTQVNKIIIDLPTNTKTNYNKIEIIAKGKNHGFDLVSIKNQLPQPPTLLNRLTTLVTRKNTTKLDLPKQQNLQNNSAIRSATPVTPVNTPKSSWFPKLWGGRRKTQRKTKNHMRKGSRKIHRK